MDKFLVLLIVFFYVLNLPKAYLDIDVLLSRS